MVEAEFGAHVRGRGERPTVERDPGGVGHAGEAVERGNREAGLDERGVPELIDDRGASRRQVGQVEVRGTGEREQRRPSGNTSAHVERRTEIDVDAEC